MAETSQEYGTVIGADAKFTGDFHFDSAAKVLGKIEGSISSKGKVLIADGAQCKATVSAKEVSVEGHVDGNVQAADRVELKPKGKITGDIVAARMAMSEGAAIDGHCRIGVEGGSSSSSKSNASTEVKTTPQAQEAVVGRR